MFSLVANLLTPVFSGIRLVASERVAQQTQPVDFEDTACVRATHADDATETRPSAI
jgi:hypothetical protein